LKKKFTIANIAIQMCITQEGENPIYDGRVTVAGLGCLAMLKEAQASLPHTTTKSAAPLEYTQA
jgi:hypothetical protein